MATDYIDPKHGPKKTKVNFPKNPMFMKPNQNVRTARTEMQCVRVRCHKMIQPGREIYLLTHVPGALPPGTQVACSHECRTHWQARHPEVTRAARKRILPPKQAPKKPKKQLPAVTETRTEVRHGIEYTVNVYKEKKKPKAKVKDSPLAVRRQS